MNDSRRKYLAALKSYIETLLEADSPESLDLPTLVGWDAYIRQDITARLGAVEDRLEKVEEAAGAVALSCPLALADVDEDRVYRLLVSAGERKSGIKEIREFTRRANSLIIVDPYAYGGKTATADKYVNAFSKAARFTAPDLKRVHIIYSSIHGKTSAIQKGLRARAEEDGVKLTECDTPDIHDRVWIADRKRGLVVGNSFGGLGRERASFLLDLPPADLEAFLEFLDEHDYSRSMPR